MGILFAGGNLAGAHGTEGPEQSHWMTSHPAVEERLLPSQE